MEQEVGTWDSVLLENISEDSFISNIHQRYKRDCIYTYIGTSVVAVNPYRHLSLNSLDFLKSYGTKGLFQLPPHIYGLANLAYRSLIDQSEDQSIVFLGEGGSGKTESYKTIINYLTHIQEPKKIKSKYHVEVNRRRNSMSCTGAIGTPRRNSPTPSLHTIGNSLLPGERSTYVLKGRSESTDRNSTTKCKNVGFDFSHHKSTEHIPQSGAHTQMKTCVKHNHIDIRTTPSTPHKVYSSRASSSTKLNEIVIPVPTLPPRQSTCSQSKNPLSNSHDYAKTTNARGVSNMSCKNCGHMRCIRQKSFENDDPGSLKSSKKFHGSSTSIPSGFKMKTATERSNKLHGSSISLHRQYSGGSLMGEEKEGVSERLSLFDAHRIRKKAVETNSVKERNRQRKLDEYADFVKTQKLRECVECADVFLEAMGSAATLNNNNSSRYGKLVDIEIDFKGDPVGVHITHYLLEKTRITQYNIGERNFHIFYQLLLGADLQFLKYLKLYRNVEKYEILRNTAGTEEDKLNFHYTKKSLETIGLTADEVSFVFRIIATVLKMGNFVFVPVTNIDGTEGCQVSNDYELLETAQLLDIDAQILLQCLTKSTSIWVPEDSGSELDARQATACRNTLCRTMYSRLFTWLINRINDLLKSNKREKNLALLDFYGFENLENNFFEQLTINYCSEKIHQSFLETVLKWEQEIYIREGMEWIRIDFFDNESICELIDKQNYGILSLLNEPHITSDDGILLRMQQCCAGHPNFMTTGPTLTSSCFKIRHFANMVTYSVHGFQEKNTDTLPKTISIAMFQSKLPLVQCLFPEGNPKRASKKPTTLSSNLKVQLQTLLSLVKNRRNHYVFCIKPNENKQARSFEMPLVQHQVRYMSLMPLVNLYRNGHCFHMTHVKFFNRFKLLNRLTWPNFNHGSLIEGIALIIGSVPLPAPEFTIGSKNVFIRSPRTVFELEEFRKLRLEYLAVLIQKTFRMFYRRKLFSKMRESQIIISSAWRTWRECRFGIPFAGRRHLWSLYRIAREEYSAMKYQKQLQWAMDTVYRHYRNWKIRQYLLTIPMRLPANTLSPLSMEWPTPPAFLVDTSRILRGIYHRWRCYIYRRSFDQTSRNRMREKVTASIIFKDRKASYPMSVAHPFVGDYVRVRHNMQWKRMSVETNDQYVVFADIINKITRSNGKVTPILLVVSTSSMLLLDQRTLQIKYRIPATEIYRLSLSPYMDDIAVFHVKASDFGRKKGDFVFQTGHVIEIVTKLFLVIQNATAKPPEVHINTEFEANFGPQTVIFNFKYGGLSDVTSSQPKITRKGNKMEIIV